MERNPDELQQEIDALQQQLARQAQVIDELRYVLRWGAEKIDFSRGNPEYGAQTASTADTYIRTTATLVSRLLGEVAARYYPEFSERRSNSTEDPNSYPSSLPSAQTPGQTKS